MKRLAGGWPLVGATGVLTGVGHGFAAFAVSVLLTPVSLDLQLGRGAVSTAIGLGRMVAGFASPGVGYATDRLGARGVVTAGLLLTALGLAGMSVVGNELGLFLAWSLAVSAGVAAGFTVALDKVVVTGMRQRRGFALSVRFSVAALVTTALLPLVSFMVGSIGWRMTCLVWAALLLLLLPLTLSLPAVPPISLGTPPATPSPSLRQLLRDPAFWIVAFVFMAQASTVTGLTVHLVPLITDHGMPGQAAASITGTMVLLSVPVRLIAGQVADRAPARLLPLLLAAILVTEGCSIFAFWLLPGTATLLVMVFALGVAAGAPTLIVLVLCARLFGEERFATVQGGLMLLQVPGTALAPILAGYSHDITGSYGAALAIFAVLATAAAAALLLLRLPETRT